MNINYKDIGKRIQERRNKLGITQEKLAEMIDLTVGHLSGIENGSTKFSFPSIVRIANALDMSLDEAACGSLKQGKNVLKHEYAEILDDCETDEALIIVDTSKALKKSLKQRKASYED